MPALGNLRLRVRHRNYALTGDNGPKSWYPGHVFRNGSHEPACDEALLVAKALKGGPSENPRQEFSYDFLT
jgi:hypothetical protein